MKNGMKCLQVVVIVMCMMMMSAGQDCAADGTHGKELVQLVMQGNVKEVAKLLQQENIDINYQAPPNKMTPLQTAIIKGNAEICHLLIKAGADLELKNKLGNTPLMTALYKQDAALIKLLVAGGADVDSKS